MDPSVDETARYSTWKLILYGFGIFLLALLFGRKRKAGLPSGTEGSVADEGRLHRLVFNGWLIVCAISLTLVVYGVFAFFAVGDKGPVGWDFGGVQDIPGASEYSTYPYRLAPAETEPQHVDEKPADAKIDISEPPPTSGKVFEGAKHEGPGKGSMRGEYGP